MSILDSKIGSFSRHVGRGGGGVRYKIRGDHFSSWQNENFTAVVLTCWESQWPHLFHSTHKN